MGFGSIGFDSITTYFMVRFGNLSWVTIILEKFVRYKGNDEGKRSSTYLGPSLEKRGLATGNVLRGNKALLGNCCGLSLFKVNSIWRSIIRSK